ncbi:unnamed protein product [Amoebophrya sp. A120]|nr:unnamed protein product [Amoebophrya sp. A120]|eukprot:GSA120T00016887001.1
MLPYHVVDLLQQEDAKKREARTLQNQKDGLANLLNRTNDARQLENLKHFQHKSSKSPLMRDFTTSKPRCKHVQKPPFRHLRINPASSNAVTALQQTSSSSSDRYGSSSSSSAADSDTTTDEPERSLCWDGPRFAFEHWDGKEWQQLEDEPDIDPVTDCYDFRSCAMEMVKMTDEAAFLLSNEPDTQNRIPVWAEDVQWTWADVVFFFDEEGKLSKILPAWEHDHEEGEVVPDRKDKDSKEQPEEAPPPTWSSRKYTSNSVVRDMSGLWLFRFDLGDAILVRKKFNFCYARYANFGGCDMRHTQLRYAYLHGANFRGANLSEASLEDAVLYKTNFSDAYLYLASFENAGYVQTALFRYRGSAEFFGIEPSLLHASNNYHYAEWGGWCYWFALTKDRILMLRHRMEVEYLLGFLRKMHDMVLTTHTWRTYYDHWISLATMTQISSNKRAVQAILLLYYMDLESLSVVEQTNLQQMLKESKTRNIDTMVNRSSFFQEGLSELAGEEMNQAGLGQFPHGGGAARTSGRETATSSTVPLPRGQYETSFKMKSDLSNKSGNKSGNTFSGVVRAALLRRQETLGQLQPPENVYNPQPALSSVKRKSLLSESTAGGNTATPTARSKAATSATTRGGAIAGKKPVRKCAAPGEGSPRMQAESLMNNIPIRHNYDPWKSRLVPEQEIPNSARGSSLVVNNQNTNLASNLTTATLAGFGGFESTSQFYGAAGPPQGFPGSVTPAGGNKQVSPGSTVFQQRLQQGGGGAIGTTTTATSNELPSLRYRGPVAAGADAVVSPKSVGGTIGGTSSRSSSSASPMITPKQTKAKARPVPKYMLSHVVEEEQLSPLLQGRVDGQVDHDFRGNQVDPRKNIIHREGAHREAAPEGEQEAQEGEALNSSPNSSNRGVRNHPRGTPQAVPAPGETFGSSPVKTPVVRHGNKESSSGSKMSGGARSNGHGGAQQHLEDVETNSNLSSGHASTSSSSAGKKNKSFNFKKFFFPLAVEEEEKSHREVRKEAIDLREARWEKLITQTRRNQHLRSKIPDTEYAEIRKLPFLRTQHALATARALFNTRGPAPYGLLQILERDTARVLRTSDFFLIGEALNLEILYIDRVFKAKEELFSMAMTIIFSAATALLFYLMQRYFLPEIEILAANMGSDSNKIDQANAA